MRTTVETLSATPGSRTIERALGVLESFTPDARQWRTTDLAEHCELPVPTTHRILRVLERFGYVIRDPRSREYRLGPSVAGFAGESPGVAHLRDVALPVLDAVLRAAREEVSLTALSETRDHGLEVCVVGRDAGGLDTVAPMLPQPSSMPVGALHAGAPYKVLLAQLAEEELARVIHRGLEPIGPATITQPSRLRRELVSIRRRGWAFAREESAPGSWGLAVPVFGSSGTSLSALAITAPLARLDRERAKQYLSLLHLAARRLSARLGDESVDELAVRREPRGEPRWQTA